MKVVNELVAGQKLLRENLQKQQKTPCRTHQGTARSSREATASHFTADLQYTTMVAAWMLWLWVQDSHQERLSWRWPWTKPNEKIPQQ